MEDTLKKMRIVITVLSVMLGLSLVVLAGVIIYGQSIPADGYAVAADNYIESAQDHELCVNTGKAPMMLRAAVPNAAVARNVPKALLAGTIVDTDRAKETVISIYRTQPEDSTPFHCPNMFPGDVEKHVYKVRVSHVGTVTVRYHADIRPGYEKLAEVLMCKVELRGEAEPLYDGLMRDMPESLNHRITAAGRKTTDLIYDITVYLDTSVGNEYMNKELYADFRWWVEESGGYYPDYDPDPDEPAKPDDPKEDDGDLIYPPQMGDFTHFCLWFWVAMISLVVNIILLWPKRRKNNGGKEEKA